MGHAADVLREGQGAFKVEAHKFSQGAAEKIRTAGGEVSELEAAPAE